MEATEVRDHEHLDPDDYPDRDSPIGDLVVRLGWPTREVAAIFGLTIRQVRRIAAEAPGIPRRRPPVLTLAEASRMLNDYPNDPYIRPAEVEAAREWIAGQGMA